MTEKTINTSIEILGKSYPVRCIEGEVPALKEAAEYLDKQMQDIQDSGKVINLERIAIIAALNVANEFLQIRKNKLGVMDKINKRIANLQDKIDSVLHENPQAELSYSSE